MKRLMLVLMILFAVQIVSAKLLSEDVHFGRIRLGDNGYIHKYEIEEGLGSVYVYNDYPCSQVNDAKVSVRFVDGGFYDASGLFKVSKKSGTTRHFLDPIDEVESGEYLVRVSFYANGLRRVKYRYVWVE